MDKRMLAGVLALGFAGALQADVTVTAVNEQDGKPHSTTYISGGKVRMDTFEGETAFVLWSRGSNQMKVVTPSRKSYLVYDKEHMKAQLAEVNAQMKEMEAQLANLPPEMREMIQKSMPAATGGPAKSGGGKPAMSMKVEKTGRSAQKGKYSCQLVNIKVDTLGMMQHEEQLCVVPADKLGIAAGDLQVMKDLLAFMQDMTSELGALGGGVPEMDIEKLGGWPVWGGDPESG